MSDTWRLRVVARRSLLHEQGYLVLRFLAEDVAKDLDAVLDALLRVISHREHHA
jgi:very-short-patch-repair endonuclease